MNLSEIIDGIKILDIKGNTNITIDEITDDSRIKTSNGLFIALKGVKGLCLDGHRFINEAIANGAKGLVVERDVAVKGDITIVKVENTRKTMALMMSNFYKKPSKKFDLIGVTGTNGKTSVSYLTKSIFDRDNRNTGLIGGIGYIIDKKLKKTNNTTPKSIDLQKIFHYMVEEKIDSCIIEVSSQGLDFHRVDYCDFDVGVFTNLTSEHLDYHKTMENYLNAKMKLFFMTKKYNIINGDDKYGKVAINRIKNLNTNLLIYGLKDEYDVYATDITYSASGVSFNLSTPKGSIYIDMNTPGLFTVYNGLAAASCGYVYNMDLETIKEGLEDVKGVRGRFEVVPTNKNFTVIIDFAHTPYSLEMALKTIKEFAKGRIIVLFGAGGDRDKSKRSIMGEVAGLNSDLCIVTSDNPRTENPDEIIEGIIKGVKKVNGNFIKITDRKKAIEYVILNHKSEDVILLAGKGHETYTIIGKNEIPFDEREIVKNILKKLK
ncbi:UDP-N-acetylmuramoyl-L-alanyl-D-glutamate--2,6-diaminopimelate ligase [Dethiothermospora halolimnae]|uniref:UDP-N-acetylmuramoyl-L-alanyl-D-glutamate--2, 6-diaminopimelate ligase n=1 Tax=Dethiothermospora halolimnae TaxID=3114390 RepID=UPI003CCBC7CA